MPRLLLAALPALLLTLAACQSNPAAERTAAPATHRVRDDFGRALTVPVRPRRILSLAPSMTEMLWAVADPATIIGRTQNCNYPPAALTKPVLNTYPLDVEGLVRLRPDLVLTVEGMTSPDHLAQLARLGIPVYQQRYRKVMDIPRGLEDLGRLVGDSLKGKHVADSLRGELAAIRYEVEQRCHMGVPDQPDTLTVLAITWTDPIIAYGYPTLLTDALRLQRRKNAVPATISQAFPTLTREAILKLNPWIIIGGDFAALDTTLFRRYPELKQVMAYQNRCIFPVDDDLLSRPSPRIGRLLCELNLPPPPVITEIRFVPPTTRRKRK